MKHLELINTLVLENVLGTDHVGSAFPKNGKARASGNARAKEEQMFDDSGRVHIRFI
jgi:hypothetical protein